MTQRKHKTRDQGLSPLYYVHTWNAPRAGRTLGTPTEQNSITESEIHQTNQTIINLRPYKTSARPQRKEQHTQTSLAGQPPRHDVSNKKFELQATGLTKLER
jgi:hypothetical protein